MSLSDPRVIELLRHHFVAATIDDCEYFRPIPHELPVGICAQNPSESERKQLDRIRAEASRVEIPEENKPRGPVVLYILAPDGRVIDVMDQVRAEVPDVLVERLQGIVKRMGVKKGPALVEYKADGKPTTAGLKIHVVARFVDQQKVADGDHFLRSRVLAPAYYWITLPDAERLLPTGAVMASQAWTVDRETAGTLLMHAAPPTETYHLSTERIEDVALKAVAQAVTPTSITARLDGHIRMRHPWWHDEADGHVVTETVAGTLTFNPTTRTVDSLSLVTTQGLYTDAADFRIPVAAALTTE